MNSSYFEALDVHVRSSTSLAVLEAAIAPKIHVLFSGAIGRTHNLRFGLRGISKDPATAARTLVRLIGRVPPSARREWDAAKSRELDFGFSASTDGTSEWLLPPNIVLDIASLGAQVRITLYPAE